MEQEQKSSNYLFAYEMLKSSYPQMKGLNCRSLVMSEAAGNSYFESINKSEVIVFISALIGESSSLTAVIYQVKPSDGTAQQSQNISFTAGQVTNVWFRCVYIGITSSTDEAYLNCCIYEPIL